MDIYPYPQPRFMLELKKEQKIEYIAKVTTMAHGIGYTVSITRGVSNPVTMDKVKIIASSPGSPSHNFSLDL